MKVTSLFSYAPDDPILYPSRRSAVGLARVRLGLDVRFSELAAAQLAYEHRMQLSSGSGGLSASAGVLPSFAAAPYLLAQLDWQLTADDRFSYRHEIDRAFVALRPKWGEVTIGRQAIGLGRGVLFSAVDVFSPFSPAEVDREWRRGVDALRIEYRTSDTTSIELLGAFGRSWDDSAVLFRARGYIGDVDGEFILGKRAEDTMIAGTMSGIVGDAEVHAELALFDTPERQPDGGLFGEDDLVLKAVIGSSYTFNVGNGLTVLGEYHYSGFGVKDIEDALKRVADPAFQERYLRGDAQILGRHALGLQSTYPINESWATALLVLVSPADGSGLIAPSLAWDFSQNASARLSAFLPWGPDPHRGTLESEYGASPASLFLQVSMYF